MTTVVLAGALANKHTWGGSAWVRMSWADALRDLGFDVLFVDQINAADCVDEAGEPAAFVDCANARAFSRTTSAFGLAGSAALICADNGRIIGMEPDELRRRMADAPVLINLSGHLRIEELLDLVSCRVFVDLDPVYTQIWHADGLDRGGLDSHQLHFSVGANVGGPDWDLPTAGVKWRPVRQPVSLKRWPVAGGDRFDGFSTVASWRGAFGPPTWGEHTYGAKAHSFRHFTELPAIVGEDFSIVLDIDPADHSDRTQFVDGGWNVVSPEKTRGVDAFRSFIRGSGAEFSAAQDAYVRSRSGWFSDRTVRYLASGRPALVQDTGFAEQLPVGLGLVPFSDVDEAVAGAHSIVRDYARHRVAARRIAEEYFAPQAALAPLLEAAEVTV